MKNKTTAALLAFFLGGLGVHRFYLNQAGLGLAYLLFCWTLIPALIALIDFIVFLSMDEAAFNAKYNTNKNQPIIANNNKSEITAELEKMHDLMQKGVLTEEEFNAQKKKMLS